MGSRIKRVLDKTFITLSDSFSWLFIHAQWPILFELKKATVLKAMATNILASRRKEKNAYKDQVLADHLYSRICKYFDRLFN